MALKVNFIICGAQKSGTSALDAYLREHPEICMANGKELHFFDTESNFLNVKPDYSIYHSAFSSKPSHNMLGEATPIYMYWFDAPKRIWQYNPKMKLIVVLRNPIDRAYSHWNMQRSRNIENPSFWDAVHTERERCRTALPYQHRTYSYLDRGFYLEQLRRLWSCFQEEQILILRNEHLKDQPVDVLQSVCRFLEVAPFQSIETKDVHSRPYALPMSDAEKEYLRSLYEFEIRGLERALGWDCSDWLSD
jgi:hypothetical protein